MHGSEQVKQAIGRQGYAPSSAELKLQANVIASNRWICKGCEKQRAPWVYIIATLSPAIDEAISGTP